MDNLTAQIMVKALDGLDARATITAVNIANGGTPNYRPLHVSFEQALESAAKLGADSVKAVQPHIERHVTGHPDAVLRLDAELATASTTALRYAALIDLLNRQLQLHSMAVTGNR